MLEKVPGVRPRVIPRLEVVHLPTPLHKRTPVWRRAIAVVGSGAISVMTGAMLALIIGASAVWFVTTLTSRLK
jgi:hypothetical protein